MRRFHVRYDKVTPDRMPWASASTGNVIPRGRSEKERAVCDGASALRRAGLQCQSVELAAHFDLERIVDGLVLLDARFAPK
jgi:hypothetical protein